MRRWSVAVLFRHGVPAPVAPPVPPPARRGAGSVPLPRSRAPACATTQETRKVCACGSPLVRLTVYTGSGCPLACRCSCRRVFGILERRRFGQRGDARLEHRPDASCAPTSRPPSRYSAPHSASKASARMDWRRKPPVLSSPEPNNSSSPSCIACAISASGSSLTRRARRRDRSPSLAVGKLAVQAFGQQQVEHRIAEELEAFVVGALGAAMRERDDEQRAIARLVAQPGGEQFPPGWQASALMSARAFS